MNRPLKNRAFGYNKDIKYGYRYRVPLVLLTLLLSAASCSSGKKFSNIPAIAFKSVYPNVVKEGETGTMVNFAFDVKDGDGNIGNDHSAAPPYPSQIFLIDSRESSPGKHDTLDFTFPNDFDASQFDPKYGLEGVFTVSVDAAFLLLDSLHKQSGDTFHYDVFILDQANNKSNQVQTADIFLTP